MPVLGCMWKSHDRLQGLRPLFLFPMFYQKKVPHIHCMPSFPHTGKGPIHTNNGPIQVCHLFYRQGNKDLAIALNWKWFTISNAAISLPWKKDNVFVRWSADCFLRSDFDRKYFHCKIVKKGEVTEVTWGTFRRWCGSWDVTVYTVNMVTCQHLQSPV